MIVIDASVVVDLVLNLEGLATAARERLRDEDGFAAPEVFDLEVLSAIRRRERAGELSSRRARAAVDAVRELGVHRVSHDPLIDRIFLLRQRVSVYDAAYVALAEALGVPLITSDAKLARAMPPGVRVELISPG